MIKLGDFGLAVQLKHSGSKRDMTGGTSWYMAPEVYYGETVLKSDIWSLGISLIELAEGKNPFGESTPAQVMKIVCLKDPPILSGGKWSPAFVDFVSKCLMKEVSERWEASKLMNVNVVMKGNE